MRKVLAPGMRNQALLRNQQAQKELKEQEQKILEEQRRREEEYQKKQQEIKRRYEPIILKFQSNQSNSEFKLNLTEYFIREAWKAPKPKQFIVEYLTEIFKKEGVKANFEDLEISIIAEFLLYNMIFCKEELDLDDTNTQLMMNIMWELLRFKNLNYESQKKIINNLEGKNATSDWQQMKQLFYEFAEFPTHKVKKILEYLEHTYFANYRLYQYIFNNAKKTEQIKIDVTVDKPMEFAPLSEALYMGQPLLEIKGDDEDEEIRNVEQKMLQEEIQKQEEIRKKNQEEELKYKDEHDEEKCLNKKIQEVIGQNVAREEQFVQSELVKRQEELQAKIDSYLTEKNPKKK